MANKKLACSMHRKRGAGCNRRRICKGQMLRGLSGVAFDKSSAEAEISHLVRIRTLDLVRIEPDALPCGARQDAPFFL